MILTSGRLKEKQQQSLDETVVLEFFITFRNYYFASLRNQVKKGLAFDNDNSLCRSAS